MGLDALNDLVGKLPELRAEYDRLGKLIDAIETFAQGKGQAPASGPGIRSAGSKVVLRPDQFFGKTAADATLAYLQMVGQALSVKEVTRALIDGGNGSDEKAIYSAVSSALKRLKHAGTVVQPKRNMWGLSIWYGGAKKRKETDTDEAPSKTAANASGAGVVP